MRRWIRAGSSLEVVPKNTLVEFPMFPVPGVTPGAAVPPMLQGETGSPAPSSDAL